MNEEEKTIVWKPVSEYTGGRVLATNGLDILIGELNHEGDCVSEDCSSIHLCGITHFAKIDGFFPELKESEDEWIRKCIGDVVREHDWSHIFGVTKDDCLAWLEKQGEQKPFDKIQLGKKYKCVASPRYSTFMTGKIYKPEDKFLCSLMNFCSDCFEPIEDAEQKETLCDKCRKEQTSHFCQDITALGRCAVEHEQKLADKIEQKFKVGDWVACDELNTALIVNIDDDKYEVEFIDGNKGFPHIEYVDRNIEYVDRNFHLWTIQDAKDGDVLVGSKGYVILMFRGIGNVEYNDVIDYHCYYDYYRKDFIVQKDAEYWGTIKNNQLKPATKEQYDLLFKKMHEAGYEWDAKKKELKKIEDELAIWSKEDERNLKCIMKIIKEKAFADYDVDDDNNMLGIYGILESWLKSLKDRVQPRRRHTIFDEII